MKSSDSARITLQESLFNVTKGIWKVVCWFTVAWEFEPDSRRVDFVFSFFPGGPREPGYNGSKTQLSVGIYRCSWFTLWDTIEKYYMSCVIFVVFPKEFFFNSKWVFKQRQKNDMEIHSAFAKSFVWKQLQTIQQQISQQQFSQQFWDWGEIARTTLIRDTCGNPSTYLVWNANNDA